MQYVREGSVRLVPPCPRKPWMRGTSDTLQVDVRGATSRSEHRPSSQLSHHGRHESPIRADLGRSAPFPWRQPESDNRPWQRIASASPRETGPLSPDISMSRPTSHEELHDPASAVPARGDEQAARLSGEEFGTGMVGNPGRGTPCLVQPAAGTKNPSMPVDASRCQSMPSAFALPRSSATPAGCRVIRQCCAGHRRSHNPEAEEFAMSREHRPFKTTELPNPNMLEPNALRVSERMPGSRTERRGAPVNYRWSYTGGGS